jgi:hypothetical protein
MEGTRNKLKSFAWFTGKLFLAIAIINVLFYISVGTINFAQDKYYEGAIIKLGSHAWVFAHGGYEYVCHNGTKLYATHDFTEGCDYAHITTYKGENWVTLDFINSFTNYGYNYIWVSMCGTGDSECVYQYANGTCIKWDEAVSRNTHKGETIPLFTGLGFVRLSNEKKYYDWFSPSKTNAL